ncbi:MAG: Holliday junction branch migration protein RuvA [Patescibacteria group bacterium]
MIYYLDGKIAIKKDDFVVIDTNGVGRKAYMSPDAVKNLPPVGENFKLFCYLNIGRNSERLYGFPTKENLEFFESLINLSGIGPKTAVQVASIAPMEEMKKAIKNDNQEVLDKIFDIGKKRGQRVIFELSRRIKEAPEEDGVVQTLVSLGFSKKDASAALKGVSKDKSVDERVKEALKLLDNG